MDTTLPNLASHARDAFLERSAGATRDLYDLDLRIWWDWCASQGMDALAARRPHFEAFGRHLMNERGNSPRSAARRMQTLRSFYRLAVADEILERDPTVMVRFPKWQIDPESIATLTPGEVARLLAAAEETSAAHHALVALMSMLGFRVSEACAVDVEHLTVDPLGYTVITARRKGGRVTTSPIPVPLLRVIERAKGDRMSGPLILTRRGNRQTRHGAYDWVRRLCVRAGLPPETHPHTLRHASATALVEAGMPVHEVQDFMAHADVRTTMHYYRRPRSLDQHGAHVTARLFASARR
ncbi:tyrosine-type recombinase/integrase [Microbacterium oleivorans]|uniref:tyrosine-type recombinase/integrase n=1 Tax=Microbacterium oleivorans TaxID=273677 RepID=UPI0034171566